MNNQIISYLNHFQLGTALVIITGFIGGIFAFYKKAKKYKTMYDNEMKGKIIKEEHEKNEEENYKKKVDDVYSNIEIITKSIEQMSDDIKQFESNVKNELKENASLNKKNIDSLSLEIEKHTVALNKVELSLDSTNKNVSLLIESDKEDIKAYITDEYNKWSEKEYIDLISLQSIEARYAKYVEEKGNGFVKKLMTEIRNLPTEPPNKHKNDNKEDS